MHNALLLSLLAFAQTYSFFLFLLLCFWWLLFAFGRTSLGWVLTLGSGCNGTSLRFFLWLFFDCNFSFIGLLRFGGQSRFCPGTAGPVGLVAGGPARWPGGRLARLARWPGGPAGPAGPVAQWPAGPVGLAGP